MTVEEQRAAYLVGVEHSRHADRTGAKHLVGWRMDLPEVQAIGYSAVAEALVAEAVVGEWVASADGPDAGVDVVGPDGTLYGVRWTPMPRGNLVVRARDRDDLVMVLVIGTPPNQRIVGAFDSLAAKDVQYLQSEWDPPAWLVPRNRLRPL